MLIPYQKPSIHPDVALDLLEDRGLRIIDRSSALTRIERIGYYRLSAFWYPLRKIEERNGKMLRSDEFVDGSTFETAFEFYLLDKRLREALYDALERIEIAIRCSVVEAVAKRSPFAHRHGEIFNSPLLKKTEALPKSEIDLFNESQDEAFARSKEHFAKHFRQKYEGPPPIWVASGVWTWGNMSWIYQSMKAELKMEIAASIDPRFTAKAFSSWLGAMNEVRNTCAHHSRLWNKPIINKPSFKNMGDIDDFGHLFGSNGKVIPRYSERLYATLVAIAVLMKSIHPQTSWPSRTADFIRRYEISHPAMSAQVAGFPDDWLKVELWR